MVVNLFSNYDKIKGVLVYRLNFDVSIFKNVSSIFNNYPLLSPGGKTCIFRGIWVNENVFMDVSRISLGQ